jgi:hypothetical protein
MKSIKDYLLVLESEAAVNTVSSGAIATKEVPLGTKIAKRKQVEEEALDEAKKEVASYANKIGSMAKVYHNTKSNKYTVKTFLNGSHHHAHDSVHDTEEDARGAAERRINQKPVTNMESVDVHGTRPTVTTGVTPLVGEMPKQDDQETPNPAAEDRVGKDPIAHVQAPDVSAEDIQNHMFKQKQAAQQNYS